jgi:hypothetical protein
LLSSGQAEYRKAFEEFQAAQENLTKSIQKYLTTAARIPSWAIGVRVGA